MRVQRATQLAHEYKLSRDAIIRFFDWIPPKTERSMLDTYLRLGPEFTWDEMQEKKDNVLNQIKEIETERSENDLPIYVYKVKKKT